MGSVEDARIALLSQLIDHAPLFPPASLPLPDAVAEDARAREGPLFEPVEELQAGVLPL